MTIEQFAVLMGSKSTGRKDYNKEEQLPTRIEEALRKISSKTVPLKLVVNDPTGWKIYRRLDENTWIRKPAKVEWGNGMDIELDDDLIDAAMYYVMAGLEPQRAKTMMGMYYSAVEEYDRRLIETYLAEASDDAERYRIYP